MVVSRELESMLSTCAVCRGWAEQDEGPYYRNALPERRDVVEDREGLELQLGIRLIRDDASPARTPPSRSGSATPSVTTRASRPLNLRP